MSELPPRYERIFSRILKDLEDPEACHTTAILQGMEAIAMELSELNVAASALMDVPVQLETVIHHLEKIDGSTDELATLERERDADS